MKKISLLLFATIISLAAMAQLNPYAYGLSSNWNETDQKLTVNFNLNDKAKKITIFAIDSENANNKFTIYEGNPGDKIDFSGNNGVVIKFDGRKFKNQNGVDACLVAGKKYTFAIQVDGAERKTPGTPVYTGNRPYSPHGVAVNNCQDSQDFGAVYVTECTNGVSGDTWGWLSGKGQSLLKYSPQLKFEDSYRKSSNFSHRNGSTLLEPHRVVVSDDGRIFVSSNNKQDRNGNAVVWEFSPQSKSYTTIVTSNLSYGDRVVAIDVKGSGNNIKMLVCYLRMSGTYGYYVYEYSIKGTSATVENGGAPKCTYLPMNRVGTSDGYYQQTLINACSYGYYHYTDGFFDLAYGAKKETTVYMGIDFYINLADGNKVGNRTSLIYFDADLGTTEMYNYYNCDGKVVGENWGGAGLVTYLDHLGNERIASGRCQNADKAEGDGRIQIYTLDAANDPTTKVYNPITTNTRSVINDLAIDCANNLYAVSFTDGTTSTGSGTLLAVPMPYSGTVTTIAPSSNAPENKYFQLPARTNLPENINSTNLQTIIENNAGGCGCAISFNRPMQADMFNTICLPFNLNLGTLSDGHPLKGAELKAFTGATLSDTDSGEKILTLNFEDVNSNTLTAYTPYLIEPKADISGVINIDNITFVSSNELEIEKSIQGMDNNNKIYFKGIVPSQTVTPKEVDGKSLTMMLVSDNRLAMMTEEGTMPGFRGYFEFATTPPQGMQARISTSKNTTTGTEVVIDGQKVNIEKFLRDGRVYIRVGETLYTITGEKVIR